MIRLWQRKVCGFVIIAQAQVWTHSLYSFTFSFTRSSSSSLKKKSIVYVTRGHILWHAFLWSEHTQQHGFWGGFKKKIFLFSLSFVVVNVYDMLVKCPNE